MNPHDEDLVEDYLDHALAPVVGLVPYRQRTGIRNELREHLCSLIEDGKSPAEALSELGDPWDVGDRFLREWEQASAPTPSARISRSGFAAAFVLFGMPFGVILHLIQEAALLPARTGYAYLAEEISSLVPFVCGALLGCTRPAHAAKNAALVCLVLTGYGLLCGLTAGPREELLNISIRVLVYWTLPATLCAGLSAAFFRRQRRRRFWKSLRAEIVNPAGPVPRTTGGTRNEASLHAR